MKSNKIFLSILVLIIIIILTVVVYPLFLSKCPYEIGSSIIDWLKQSCPYTINGVIIDRISGEGIDDATISLPKGVVNSVNGGEFFVKTKGELSKIIISKDGYHIKEVNISVSKKTLEINLGKISLEPEAKITGIIIDRISETPLKNAILSFGKGQTTSSSQGEFIFKTSKDISRKDINKVVINKEGYLTKEIEISIGEDDREINLGKISLEPEARVIGTTIDWLFEKPLSQININFGKGETVSSATGGFIIKTSNEVGRQDITRLVIKKDGYQKKEVPVFIGDNDREINLGKIYIMPEGKAVYQRNSSIFSANFDGSEVRKLADGVLLAISSAYDKFVFKTSDKALHLMNINGANQMRFAYQMTPSNRPAFTTFSINGEIIAWINSHEITGSEGTRMDEEVFYYNFVSDKQDGVRQIFRNIYNFRISPDGKFIAVIGVLHDGSQVVHLEDIVNHKTIFQIKNPNNYFFDEDNFYYSILNSSWYIHHLQDGKRDTLTTEPIWWENKFTGVVNPYAKEKMVVQKGSSINLTDSKGLNAKRIAEFDFPGGGFISDLQWGPNGKYLLFKISLSPYPYKTSLWILDIDSGIYKKIVDEAAE